MKILLLLTLLLSFSVSAERPDQRESEAIAEGIKSLNSKCSKFSSSDKKLCERAFKREKREMFKRLAKHQMKSEEKYQRKVVKDAIHEEDQLKKYRKKLDKLGISYSQGHTSSELKALYDAEIAAQKLAKEIADLRAKLDEYGVSYSPTDDKPTLQGKLNDYKQSQEGSGSGSGS